MELTKDVIRSLSWRLVERSREVADDVGWRKFDHFGDYTMRQLYHMINLAFDREILPAYKHFASGQDIGLEFLVEKESGEKIRFDSDLDLVELFGSSFTPGGTRTQRFRPNLLGRLKKMMRRQKEDVVEILTV